MVRPDGIPEDENWGLTIQNMDEEANIFAMHLLMPSDLLRKHIKGHLAIDDDEQVAKLAAKFKVPTGVMALRLGMLIQEGRL
jgi:Zn-dependent peptidase ImmA (M78 family)